MSVEAMLAVQKLATRTSHACFRVLMTLAEHADKLGRNSWASIDTIAAEAQTDEKTVRRSLAILEADRLIVGERGRGRGKTTIWALAFPVRALGKEGVTPGISGQEDGEKEGVAPGIEPIIEGIMPGISVGKEGVTPGILGIKEGLTPVKEGLTPVKEGLTPPEPVLNLSLTLESECESPPPERNLPDEAVAIWNQICGVVLPSAQTKIPDARRAALGARLADEMGGSIEAWRAFCLRVRTAPHLIGLNDRAWRASIDWCLMPRNMAKVLEGNYDRVKPAETRQPGRSYAGCL